MKKAFIVRSEKMNPHISENHVRHIEMESKKENNKKAEQKKAKHSFAQKRFLAVDVILYRVAKIDFQRLRTTISFI